MQKGRFIWYLIYTVEGKVFEENWHDFKNLSGLGFSLYYYCLTDSHTFQKCHLISLLKFSEQKKTLLKGDEYVYTQVVESADEIENVQMCRKCADEIENLK